MALNFKVHLPILSSKNRPPRKNSLQCNDSQRSSFLTLTSDHEKREEAFCWFLVGKKSFRAAHCPQRCVLALGHDFARRPSFDRMTSLVCSSIEKERKMPRQKPPQNNCSTSSVSEKRGLSIIVFFVSSLRRCQSNNHHRTGIVFDISPTARSRQPMNDPLLRSMKFTRSSSEASTPSTPGSPSRSRCIGRRRRPSEGDSLS